MSSSTGRGRCIPPMRLSRAVTSVDYQRVLRRSPTLVAAQLQPFVESRRCEEISVTREEVMHIERLAAT